MSNEGVSEIIVRRTSGGPVNYLVRGAVPDVKAKLVSAMRSGKLKPKMTSARTGKLIVVDLTDCEVYSVKASHA